MRSAADLRGVAPLVSFNHVIDPRFVTTFSSSLYTTIRNPNLNRNPTVITDQAAEFRKLSPFRSAPLRILSRSPFLAFSASVIVDCTYIFSDVR